MAPKISVKNQTAKAAYAYQVTLFCVTAADREKSISYTWISISEVEKVC